MNARELWKRRIGEWVFGSAVAWGCTVPFGAGGDLFGGQNNGPGGGWGHCSGTTTVPCQSNMGGTCSGSTCTCIMETWHGGGSQCDPIETEGALGTVCPTGCHPAMQPSSCKGGGVPMGPCYYPPE